MILFSALFLRFALNVVRQKVFYQKPFIYSNEKFYGTLKNDENWYGRTAKAFLEGKGICVLDLKWWGVNSDGSFTLLNRVDMVFKKIDGDYYAHKFIPPLYPLFLSAVFFIFGVNTLAYFIPQILMSSITCVLIYRIAKIIFNEEVALISGFIVAFYPDMIFWPYFLRTETLFIFLFTAGFWLLLLGNCRNNLLTLCISAVFFGFACLTRVTFMPFLPVLIAWEYFYFSKDRITNVLACLLIGTVIMLMLLPWSLRNEKVFNNFTPLTDEITSAVLYKTDTAYYMHSGSSVSSRIAMFVKNETKLYIIASFKRFAYFWSAVTYSMKPETKAYKAATWILVFPLAFWGLFSSRKNCRKSGLFALFILYYAVLHAASFVDVLLVYRYPIQNFLSMFAAYGLFDGFNKYNIKLPILYIAETDEYIINIY
jgi:4-amino-4-deoxy-L-arabinose transferase-like glycosyltransferase